MAGTADDNIFVSATDGTIRHFDGNSLVEEPTPGGGEVRFLAGSGQDVYGVGDDGLAWRRNPTNRTWSQLADIELRAGESFSGLAPGSDGGGVYAIQDTAGGIAGGSFGRVWSLTRPMDRVSTIDLRIDYLRPGRSQALIATAEVVRLGNRVGVTQLRAFHDGFEDNPVAAGMGVYSVRRTDDESGPQSWAWPRVAEP